MSDDGPQRPRYPEYPGEHGPDAARPDWPSVARPPASAPADGVAPQPAQAWPTQPGPTGTPPGPIGTPAGWWIRVAAALVDGILAFAVAVVPVLAGLYVAFVDSTYDEATDTISGVEPLGIVLAGLGFLVFLAFDVWNRGLRVGYQGSSLGKQLAGVRVVNAGGGLLGPAEGFFRWFVGQLLQWTFVGAAIDLLWPLWDGRKQTIHDKAIGSFPLVVR